MTIDILEEQQYWLFFGYKTNDMIFCIDCQKIHVNDSNCQRNG